MPVNLSGSLNTQNLNVPDVYINVIPPSVNELNGVPTNIAGLVGVSSWGPVNSPQIIAGDADGQALFGAITVRQYDLMTALDIAGLQGASNFRLVRVTDGTDAAATFALAQKSVASIPVTTPGSGYTTAPAVVIGAPNVAGGIQAVAHTVLSGATVASVVIDNPGTGYNSPPAVSLTGGGGSGAALGTAVVGTGTNITGTSKWTGSGGNGSQFAIDVGSASASWKLTIYKPGTLPEVFDNLAAGLTGAAVWTAIASAVNNGITNLRGPSRLMTMAVPGSSPGADVPVPATYTLAGGTDGASGVGKTQLLGVDGSALNRTGMYALRGTQVSVAGIPDLGDSTAWTLQVAFGLSEGVYMVSCGPISDTINNAVASRKTAGIDSPALKLCFGDWCYYSDQVNGVTRLCSPIAWGVGILSNLSPEQSSLNKPLQGIVATQQSQTGVPYTGAELGALSGGGWDVIANPNPGGAYFGFRLGLNSSSNTAENQDNYPRLTNFIAYTLAAGLGQFVGPPQTGDQRLAAKATLDDFLQGLADNKPNAMIGNADGVSPAFNVKLDSDNNPFQQVARGYMQADVKVTYLAITRYFIVNLQAGQTVQVKSPLSTISLG